MTNFIAGGMRGQFIISESYDEVLAFYRSLKKPAIIGTFSPIDPDGGAEQFVWVWLRGQKDWRTKSQIGKRMQNVANGAEVSAALGSLIKLKWVESRLVGTRGRKRSEYRAITQGLSQ